MKILIFLSILLLPFISSAQHVWAPIGAKWYYNQKDISSSGQGYIIFESIKDTIVENKACKIIIESEYHYNGTKIKQQKYILCEDNRKVYMFQEKEFKLLYNFEAEKGDTVKIRAHLQPKQCDSTVLVIDSLSNIVINEMNHKVLFHHNLTSCEYGSQSIEFIGSLGYFLPFNSNADPIPGNLRCYSDDKIYFSNDWNYPCDTLITAVATFKSNWEAKIFPNPFNEKLYIEFSDQKKHKIEIFNVAGKIMYCKHKITSKVLIDTSGWNTDIYIVKFDNKTNMKILKL